MSKAYSWRSVAVAAAIAVALIVGAVAGKALGPECDCECFQSAETAEHLRFCQRISGTR